VKIAGTAFLPGTPEQAWELLNDPQRLAKLLPGCERLEPDGPDRYKAVIKFALAAVSGTYSGSVQLSEKKPPRSLRMKIEGKGLPGFVNGSGELHLAANNNQTEVTYTGEAQVGGLIASVGQRMIEGASRKIIHEFFDRAARLLQL
jgi:carbon monoxide dehydrogenase subunit G